MKYVILRDPQRRISQSGGGTVTFRGPARDWAPPSVQVADVNARDRVDLGNDPEVAGMAALMPTRLVEPRDVDLAAGGGAGDSWGIGAVRADASQFSGAGVRVAVLDTGIDSTHPAFTGVELVEEDFTGDGDGDKRGHGTHCAGTIFGRDVAGTRIGVARGVRQAWIGKVIGNDGRGDTQALYNGLIWAMQEKAQVISMSIGFDFPGMVSSRIADGWPSDLATSVTLETYRGNVRLFDRLIAMIQSGRPGARTGCVVVAAAGNESQRDVHPEYEIGVSLPAAAEGVLSTGALEEAQGGFRIAPYSNTFPQLCAPGTDIRSAVPGGGLGLMSGTSMACPHVAGLAALWWEAQHASRLPPTATAVAGKIAATCRLDVLAPDVDPAARGNGMATAP